MNLSLFTFIQEISVVITSSYQVIEVSPFTTALIEHIYAQYQCLGRYLSDDDRVSVVVPVPGSYDATGTDHNIIIFLI